MRPFLISVVLLGLIAGCAGGKYGAHRIDVQQGNALDQENVARLKTGLNRSQVRFLLGTPLVVDPFRTDRWDYVYVYYKAGKLAEQKRVSLFFDGDTLVRIEGDVPVAEPPAAPAPVQAPAPAPVSQAAPAAPAAPPAAPAVPAAATQAVPAIDVAAPVAAQSAPVQAPLAVTRPPASAPVATSSPVDAAPSSRPAPTGTRTSIVPPLTAPRSPSAPAAAQPAAGVALQAATDVGELRPDVMPAFPQAAAAPGRDQPVMEALKAWAEAWSRRDEAAYLAAYDASFVPSGGDSRADWEKRRRLLLSMARSIEVKVESPVLDRSADGSVSVTFNQHYRAENYRDAVVKQLRFVERDGRWLIVEERVLSVLPGRRS
jgi:outer membrane protein assembly factor BamE